MQWYDMAKKLNRKAAETNAAATDTTGAIADYGKWQNAMQGYNVNRVPQGAALEAASSNAIAGLLNPPAAFPDVQRQAAELSAGRGVAGSPAAMGTYLRMSDDERLKRIKLGQDMLTQAMGRYPTSEAPSPDNLFISPYQQQALNIESAKVANAANAASRASSSGSSNANPTPYFTYQNLIEPYWWKSPL